MIRNQIQMTKLSRYLLQSFTEHSYSNSANVLIINNKLRRNICTGKQIARVRYNRLLDPLISQTFLRKKCSANIHKCIALRKFSSVSLNALSLDNPKVKSYLEGLKKKYSDALASQDSGETVLLVMSLKPLIDAVEQAETLISEREELTSMANDDSLDEEMKFLAQEDLLENKSKLQDVENQILGLLVPPQPIDDTDVVIEVTAGVGGQEAMLFTQELFSMYQNYADFMGWSFEEYEYATTDIGGLRQGCATISGEGAYRRLKYEGGVHRVQRIPKTEKAGRIHTSTSTVAILPQPSEVDVVILDKDLKIETKRASGAGGQHVNTTDSAVRIVHLPSGLAVESQSERSQIRNRELAMARLRAKLYQIKVDEAMAKVTSSRKLQVGSKARSDKIRTYNFPQGRVTDHRIGLSMHNLSMVLDGGEHLDELIDELMKEAYQEDLLEILESS
ncbi:mitochondrial translation release factor 1 [Oratosquilla oratoria]|uniref:mitochondrial translation release factor 1 n=1 Tax=Oratosquilla oratoria TaxID=337810 RepID=UPI003F75DD47